MQLVEMYINGVGCISPQPTFDNSSFLEEVKEYTTNRIYCVEGNHSEFFDVTSLRRMSRIVKFGTAAGLIALRDAGIKTPEAISTGTGYGLLELSQRFLRDFISSSEGVVSPTSFIQSTHNTVSSNIALLTGCHEHNNTFSQKGISVESTWYDAQFLLNEGKKNVLVGSYEEIGEFNYSSLMQNKELLPEPCSNIAILNGQHQGTIVGEGAAFFLVSKEKSNNTYCRLLAHQTVYREPNIEQALLQFLEQSNIAVADIDIVLSGLNGDAQNDAPLHAINQKCFGNATLLGFKHLCGEYMTASSFAIYIIAQILQKQFIPQPLLLRNANRPIGKVLLHNNFKHYHSFFLFEKC